LPSPSKVIKIRFHIEEERLGTSMNRLSKYKNTILTLCLGAGLVSLFATTQAAGPTPRVLKTRTLGFVKNLDWQQSVVWAEGGIIGNLMEGLVAADPGTSPTPALAKSWTVRPDGLVYTFKLRPGLKWSDGAPLKASEFVYSWERLLTPTKAAKYDYILDDIEGAKDFRTGKLKDFKKVGVRALDDTTLEITLQTPNPTFIWSLSYWPSYPVRKDLIEKYAEDWTKPGIIAVLGPFIPIVHDARNIVLAKNPHYWGPRGNVDQVFAVTTDDDDASLQMFEAKQIDYIPKLDTPHINRISNKADLITFESPRLFRIQFNLKRDPSADHSFRQAIAAGINRKSFKRAEDLKLRPAFSLSFPGMLGFSTEPLIERSPGEARRTIASVTTNFKRPIEIVTLSSDDKFVMAEFVKKQLQENLGLNAVVKAYERDALAKVLERGEYDIWLASTSARNPDPDHVYSAYFGSNFYGNSTVDDQRFKNLLLEAKIEKNSKRRALLYKSVQRFLMKDWIVTVPLFYDTGWAVARQSVILKAPMSPYKIGYYRDIIMK